MGWKKDMTSNHVDLAGVTKSECLEPNGGKAAAGFL